MIEMPPTGYESASSRKATCPSVMIALSFESREIRVAGNNRLKPQIIEQAKAFVQ